MSRTRQAYQPIDAHDIAQLEDKHFTMAGCRHSLQDASRAPMLFVKKASLPECHYTGAKERSYMMALSSRQLDSFIRPPFQKRRDYLYERRRR